MVVRAAGQLQRRESTLEHQVETLSGTFSFKEHTASRGGAGSGFERRTEPSHIFIIRNTWVHKIFGCDSEDWVNQAKHNYDVSHEMSIKGSS